jgi:hypothetical protein
LNGRQTHYQLNFHNKHNGGSFYETYEVTVKNMKNKFACYKEIVECQHLIFWPESQEYDLLPYCRTRVKSEGNIQLGPPVSPCLSVLWVFEFIPCPESTMHIKYSNSMCMHVHRKEREMYTIKFLSNIFVLFIVKTSLS